MLAGSSHAGAVQFRCTRYSQTCHFSHGSHSVAQLAVFEEQSPNDSLFATAEKARVPE